MILIRLLLLLSLLPIAVGIAMRWWFGSRIIASEGPRACRCNLDTWLPSPGDQQAVHRAEGSAAEFGRQLRDKALADWLTSDAKSAKSRESSRRLGMIAPPFSAIIAIFAVLVGKIPLIAGFAIFAVTAALATIFNQLSITSELIRITRATQKAREEQAFPNHDDHEAVSRCAIAHAWEDSIPTMFKWI